MKRANSKIGDVFSVKIDGHSKKYLQYIVNDLTQLNSDIIRAFIAVYPIDAIYDLSEVVNGEVEFYAHCVTKLGIKLGFWERVGNIANVGKIDHILFRDSSDYGNPQIKISHNWWIWKINEEQRQIGKLEGVNQKAEIGLVINPESIVHRMRTGEYDLKKYPKY
nr:hypothetical protein [Bacteroidota bacterium]